MANIGQPLFLSKVSKLQSDGAAQPARFEESFAGGVDLQSHDFRHQPLYGPCHFLRTEMPNMV